MARLAVTPREAAALSRLLDAYIATADEADAGMGHLVDLQAKVDQLPQDHACYTAALAPNRADGTR